MYAPTFGSQRLLFSGALLVFAMAGCVSSHVIVGKVRPAISPDEVHLYLHPPAHYEEVALLNTSSKDSFSFTAQGKTDAVVKRLKAQAAKMGANGILLEDVGDQVQGSVGTGVGATGGIGGTSTGVGVGGSNTVYRKAGNGIAIYVPPN
jgi:hypothetical protein